MPRCEIEYGYYATLLPCNQFHRGTGGGGRALTGCGVWPLRTATVHGLANVYYQSDLDIIVLKYVMSIVTIVTV